MTKDADGPYESTIEFPHISYKNVDYYFCKTNASIDISGPDPSQDRNIYMFVDGKLFIVFHFAASLLLNLTEIYIYKIQTIQSPMSLGEMCWEVFPKMF